MHRTTVDPSSRSRAFFVLLLVAALGWATAGHAQSTNEEYWRNSLETGRSALASGNMTVAENFARQAINNAMALSPTPSTNLALAESYELMADVEAVNGALGRAEDWTNQAIAIRRAAQPSDHPDLGRAVLRFANLQRIAGNLAQADRLYRSSIETISTALGPRDILLADAYYGLALNELEQNRTESADLMLARSAGILGQQDELALRDHLPNLQPFYGRYQEMGLLDDAQQVMRQAMDLYARHYAVDSPYFVEAMMALGALQLDRGRADDARGTFDRGTDEMLQALGPGSERVATTMEKIADLFEAYDRPADTKAYHAKAVDVRQRTVAGGSDAAQVRSLVRLGELSRQRGETARAGRFYREAVDLAEARLGPNDAETAFALSAMAFNSWEQRKAAEADRLWSRALAIYERVLGPDDPNVASVAFNLAQLRHGHGRYAEAEALYRKALDIRERALGRTHPQTLESINRYALLLDSLGRRAEADQVRARGN